MPPAFDVIRSFGGVTSFTHHRKVNGPAAAADRVSKTKS